MAENALSIVAVIAAIAKARHAPTLKIEDSKQ